MFQDPAVRNDILRGIMTRQQHLQDTVDELQQQLRQQRDIVDINQEHVQALYRVERDRDQVENETIGWGEFNIKTASEKQQLNIALYDTYMGILGHTFRNDCVICVAVFTCTCVHIYS